MASVNVCTGGSPEVPVTAYYQSMVPGLAVTRSPQPGSKLYHVTHCASGKCLDHSPTTRERSKARMAAYGKLPIDWTLTEEQLGETIAHPASELREAFRAIGCMEA